MLFFFGHPQSADDVSINKPVCGFSHCRGQCHWKRSVYKPQPIIKTTIDLIEIL